MLHEVWTALADGGSSSDTWLTALITTLGVLGAASVAAFAGTFRRHPQALGVARASGLVRELRRRATAAETRASRLDTENQQLREMLLRHDIDPHTGERLVDRV